MTSGSGEPTPNDVANSFSFARPNASNEERLAILGAAAAAFFEFGFNNTSVDEIADRLGASKGQVYHYYRSKSDILFDIQKTTTEIFLESITPIANGEHDCEERLWLMARKHALLVVQSVAFARVTLFGTGIRNYRTEQQRRAHSAIYVRRKEYENLFVSAIKEGVDNGTFRVLDPGLTAKALLGSLNWVAYWYSPGSDTPEMQEAFAADMADYAVVGVGADTDLLRMLRSRITSSAN